MSSQQNLRLALESMAARPAFLGCALVELGNGMVWHTAGLLQDMETLASTCTDHWRLYQRSRSHYADLGDMRMLVMFHEKGQLLLSQCGAGMLLAVVTAQLRPVAWEEWKQEHARLAKLVDTI